MEAAAAEQAALAAKAEAEAKIAEMKKASEAANAAREAKAEMNKKQSKTSEVFKSTMASSDNKIKPGISAIASEAGYSKALESKAEHVAKKTAGSGDKTVNPYGSVKSGASSGVGSSASKQTSGPSISTERAKASSNSNQLGTLLAGKNYNNSGRAPVWAAPGTNISAFKESEEAKEARLREEKQRIEEEEAKKRSEVQAKSSYTSIADSARTKKSAFFKRAQAGREQVPEDQEEHVSAYGGIVRPSAVIDEERDIKKTMTAPAMGAALEGQRPSIMDPNSKSAPTASRPMAGFKGAGEEDNGLADPSDEENKD